MTARTAGRRLPSRRPQIAARADASAELAGGAEDDRREAVAIAKREPITDSDHNSTVVTSIASTAPGLLVSCDGPSHLGCRSRQRLQPQGGRLLVAPAEVNREAGDAGLGVRGQHVAQLGRAEALRRRGDAECHGGRVAPTALADALQSCNEASKLVGAARPSAPRRASRLRRQRRGGRRRRSCRRRGSGCASWRRRPALHSCGQLDVAVAPGRRCTVQHARSASRYAPVRAPRPRWSSRVRRTPRRATRRRRRARLALRPASRRSRAASRAARAAVAAPRIRRSELDAPRRRREVARVS